MPGAGCEAVAVAKRLPDPVRGVPARGAASACVTGPSSLVCDALSTALLVQGDWRARLAARFPGYAGWSAPGS
jgi:thiamine biosynthesis lipoprotein ApbE